MTDFIATARMCAKKAIPEPLRSNLRKARDRVKWHNQRKIALRDLMSRQPVTFNEKVRYKMAYDRRPLLTMFADKFAVRPHVAELIGEEYLTELFAVVDPAQSIPWGALPKEFVAKPTHGSAALVMVSETFASDPLPHQVQNVEWQPFFLHPDALIREDFTRLSKKWMALDYGRTSRGLPQWAYRHIPPRMIFEEVLRDSEGRIPADFKFFVFDGRCAVVAVDRDRFSGHKRDLFSVRWELLPVTYTYPNSTDPPAAPSMLSTMIQVAETLGSGIDFVRVDLYQVGDRVVFGELTNYPEAATGRFDPEQFDEWLGSHWTVPSLTSVGEGLTPDHRVQLPRRRRTT